MSKNKHLILNERYNIEHGLDKKLSFKAIAKDIDKDCSTISKEIRAHIIFEKRELPTGLSMTAFTELIALTMVMSAMTASARKPTVLFVAGVFLFALITSRKLVLSFSGLLMSVMGATISVSVLWKKDFIRLFLLRKSMKLSEQKPVPALIFLNRRSNSWIPSSVLCSKTGNLCTIYLPIIRTPSPAVKKLLMSMLTMAFLLPKT